HTLDRNDQRAEHLRKQGKIGTDRRHGPADAFQGRDDAIGSWGRRGQRLRAGVNLLEEAAIVFAQSDKTRVASLLCPVAQRALDQPGTVSVEIIDPGNIDGDAARSDAARDSLDLWLDGAGIFSGPRSGSAELNPIAPRLVTEQDAR